MPASQVLSELALANVALRADNEAFRLGGADPVRTRNEYHAERRKEQQLLARLLVLTDQISPSVGALADALPPLYARVSTSADARVDGAIDEAQFQAALPAFKSTLDSLAAARNAVQHAVDSTLTSTRASTAAFVARQRWLSFALGLVAIGSVVVIGWLARQERRLSDALARASVVERGLRSESEERRAALERLSETKARLMRGFSHDVKNPLGAADGFLSLLEDGIIDPLTPRQRDTVSRVRRSIDTALTLIHDLLDVARTESGRVEVSPVPTDVGELIRDVVAEYQAQADVKKLTLAVSVPQSMAALTTDPLRVRQIVGNLISNAVKYTVQGGIVVRAYDAQGADDQTAHIVRIEVADTGRGIPESQRKLLFQEFVRLDPTAAAGTGIGLAISQRIARALGGNLVAQSGDGQGSTFTLILPRQTSGALIRDDADPQFVDSNAYAGGSAT